MADPTAQYLARFRAASPEQRRDAVIKLGKSGDKRAIPLLQQMAATEPDPHVHDLMLKAIQHLQSPNPTIANAPPPTIAAVPPASPSYGTGYSAYDQPLSDSSPSSYALSTEVSPVEAEPVKPVSEKQKQFAKTRLDFALSLHISKQNDKALSVLAEAVSVDPSILDTQMGRNLAMALTGEPDDRAVEIIRAKSQDPHVVGAASRPEFKVTLSAELFDTAIEMLGLFVVIVLLFALGINGIGLLANRLFNNTGYNSGINMSDIIATDTARIQESGASPSAQATEIAALQQVQSLNESLQASTSSVPALLKTALSLALRAMLSTFLGILAAYIVGTLIGGVGGLMRFFRYLTRAYIAVYLALLISVLLAYFLGSNPNLPADTRDTVGSVALFLIGADALVGFVIIDYAAARGHQFGLLKGFVSVFVGNIVLGVLLGLLGVGSVFNGLGF